MDIYIDLIFAFLLVLAIYLDYRKNKIPRKKQVFNRISLLLICFGIITVFILNIDSSLFPLVRNIIKYSLYTLIGFYYLNLFWKKKLKD